ncbi:Zea mays Retrotransposon Opie-2 [Phytophthora cinnamomi]|uniref:Zea mays Retrotransposon Opie-2 n=1 Tax=Phytophthora cinnamomi TaxID=4785 RepID=UPI00355A2140|nr:Zea mays Retrotransposon Opie-2 [Phytophthora cinnamomi]
MALEPAIIAQIASVGPALTALAAAFEQEPNHDDESDSGAGEINNAVRGKRSDKIDLRSIKVERFDGSVATGNFDAKARDFCEELDEQIDDAQALAGRKAVPVNARHALVAFVRNEYPKFKDFLETKVSLEDDKPEDQLKVAVAALARKAETDGRLPDRRKTKVAQPAATALKSKNAKPASKKPQQTITKNAKNPKKRPAEAQAQAAVV